MERFKSLPKVKIRAAAVVLISVCSYHFVADIYKIGVKDGKAERDLQTKHHTAKR